MAITIERPAMLRQFNNTIYDGIGPAVTAVGSPIISTTIKQFGTGSLYLDGSSYLTMPMSDEFNFGDRDFTVGWWDYLTASTGGAAAFFAGRYGIRGLVFGFVSGSNRIIQLSSTDDSWNINVNMGVSTINTWNYWEVGRHDGTFYCFKNGILTESKYYSKSLYYDTTEYVSYVGRYGALMKGYIDDLFILKGTCLHTSDFTPNAEEYIADMSLRTVVGIQLELATGSRSIVNSGGLLLPNITSSSRGIVNSRGELFPSVTNGLRNRLRHGTYLDNINAGNRSVIKQGFPFAYSLIVDSNASYKYRVIVTPTHQYKSQLITVTADNKLATIGKWSFKVGDITTIPWSSKQTLASIEYIIDNSTLSTGVNYCKLMFEYEDGTTDFVPLKITKEAFKRTIVERTAYDYDGGYILNNVRSLYDGKSSRCFSPSTFGTRGSVETTPDTCINLSNYSGIIGLNLDGQGCKVLVSFDNKVTWYGWSDTVGFVTAAIDTIDTYGISINILNSLTQLQWSTIFQPTQLDFHILIDNLNVAGGVTTAYLNTLIVTLPENLPPAINDVALTPSTLHSGNAVLSATIADPENDDIQYRITINTDEITPWTNYAPGPTTIEATISADTCPVGTNAVEIKAYDGDKYGTYKTYLTRTNDNPNIIGILSGMQLTATIGDADNDTVRYRILLNGIIKQDWSDLLPSPVTLEYAIDPVDVITGQQNSLMVEAEDALGGTGSCAFDFVGKSLKKKYAFIM